MGIFIEVHESTSFPFKTFAGEELTFHLRNNQYTDTQLLLCTVTDVRVANFPEENFKK